MEITLNRDFKNSSQGLDKVASKMIGAGELVLELEKKLETSVVHFVYEKKDGTFRHSFGTRCPELLPKKLPEQLSDLFNKYSKEGSTTGADAVEGLMAYMSSVDKPKKPYTADPAWVNYFDYQANDWRKFNNLALVAIIY